MASDKAYWKNFGSILIFAILYWALAYLCYKLAPQYAHATAIWFPFGLSLAVFLLHGPKLWPGSFLGSILFTQSLGLEWIPSLLSAAGDTLSPLLGVWLLKRVCKFDLKIASFHDAISLIIFGIFFPPVISAFIGTYSLYLANLAPESILPEIMMIWWLSDVAGAIILTPLLIAFYKPRVVLERRKYARLEMIFLLSSHVLTSWILYTQGYKLLLSHMIPLYANLVFVIWAALRFDLRVTMIVSGVAGLAALYGDIIIFPTHDVAQQGVRILHLQVLTSTIMAMGLLLSAATRQQQEITESLKESMANYLSSEDRLAFALKAVKMGAWSLDIQSGNLTWSDEVEGIFGMEKGSFNGKLNGFLDRIYPPDRERVEQIIKSSLEKEVPGYSMDYRIQWHDGSFRWLESKGQVFKDGHGKPIRVAGVITDVTEKRQIASIRERLLAQETEARIGAERSVQQRDDFLSIASHELKTPLTAVLLSIQMAKRQIGKKPEEAIKNLSTAEMNLNRFLKLVSNLLDVSRISAQRLTLNPQEFDLSVLIQEIVERLRPEFTAFDCSLSLDIQPHIIGEWDMIRMEQVITNLLTNAMKYGMGSPIELKLFQEKDTVKFHVKDQGIGISESDISKIFQRFERVAPEQRQYGGLGLGLYITKNIIDAHGGNIYVKSEFGKGSTFIVELPLKIKTPA